MLLTTTQLANNWNGLLFHSFMQSWISSFSWLFFQPSFNLYVSVDDSAVYKPPPELPKVTSMMRIYPRQELQSWKDIPTLDLFQERREEEGGEKDCSNCEVKKLVLTSIKHFKKVHSKCFQGEEKGDRSCAPKSRAKKVGYKSKKMKNERHDIWQMLPPDHLQHRQRKQNQSWSQNQLWKKNQSLNQNQNQNQSQKSHKRVLRKSKSLLSISNTILTCWFEGHQQRPLWWQRWRHHWKMVRKTCRPSLVT